MSEKTFKIEGLRSDEMRVLVGLIETALDDVVDVPSIEKFRALQFTIAYQGMQQGLCLEPDKE